MLKLLRNSKKILSFCFSESIDKYVISSRIGGHSSQKLYDIYAGSYRNKTLEDFKEKNKQFGISVITTAEECEKCVKILEKVQNIVAWDTETIDLDIKNQSPVGRGKIICASFFAGPEFDFGNGPKVFIDNFGTNAGLLNNFKGYLQSEKYKKVWHNYGFDRHVFHNHGINVRGFGGDTMHMARLYDASRSFGEYSLASLTKDYVDGIQKVTKIYMNKAISRIQSKIEEGNITQEEIKQLEYQLKILDAYELLRKKSGNLKKVKMDNLFMRKKILKSGDEGKTYQFPTTLTLHTSPEHIKKWIQYSVLDSESTFFLRETLEKALRSQKSSQYDGITNIWQIYEKYWRPLGQLLTDMEREGFKINIDHMKKIEQEAIQKINEKKQQFMNFLKTFQDDENIDLFNPSSNLQMQQLLHAPFKVDQETVKNQEMERKKKQQKMIKKDDELKELGNVDSKSGMKKDMRKVGERINLSQLPWIKQFQIQNDDCERSKRKKVSMSVKGLGIPAVKTTATGLPSVDEDSLKILAGSPKNGKFGKAFEHFATLGNQQFGIKLCQGLQKLIQYKSIETLLVTFIQPLQSFTDQNDRIHCSLNINTETGRLSSKKPNLQNQPALEKDIYKIRSAFTVEKGNKMIVADYGQLELRVLAHITQCKGMLSAFKQGGDFHSRTAIGMFDYIKKDIDEGNIILEWDKSLGVAPVPLLKQKYASERKKAKTVNFSIAYGKTAQGFAEDWNCSVQQAKQIIRKWFNDRPEVEQWQKHKQSIAKQKKKTQTLLGRYRRLDKFFASNDYNQKVGMGLRRAINTPIQGGAADIVIASMVKIHQNQELRKMGWKLLLQIHDELILQGPEQSVERAYQIVKDSMMHPFDKDLLVQLQIDGKIGTTWYECK